MSICLGIKQIFEKSSPCTNRIGTFSDTKRKKCSSILNEHSSLKKSLLTNQVDNTEQEKNHSVKKSRLCKGIVDSDLSDGKCKNNLILKKKRKTLNNSDLFGTYDNFLHRSRIDTRIIESPNNNVCSSLRTEAKIIQASFFNESPLSISGNNETTIYEDTDPLVDTPPSQQKEGYTLKKSHCRLGAIKMKDIIGDVTFPKRPILTLTFDQEDAPSKSNNTASSTSTRSSRNSNNNKENHSDLLNYNNIVRNVSVNNNYIRKLDSQDNSHDTEEDWKCPKCTLINLFNNNSCEVCGDDNPRRTQSASRTSFQDLLKEKVDPSLPPSSTAARDHPPAASSLLTPPQPAVPAAVQAAVPVPVIPKEPLPSSNTTATSTSSSTTSTSTTSVPQSTTWTCAVCTYENPLPPGDSSSGKESPLRSLKGRPNRTRNRGGRLVKCEICESPLNASQVEALLKDTNSSSSGGSSNKINDIPEKNHANPTTNSNNQIIENSNIVSSSKNLYTANDKIPFDSTSILNLTQTSTSTTTSLSPVISDNYENINKINFDANLVNNGYNPKSMSSGHPSITTAEDHEVSIKGNSYNYHNTDIEKLSLNNNNNNNNSSSSSSHRIDKTHKNDSNTSSNASSYSLFENTRNINNNELQGLQNIIQTKAAPNITGKTGNFISIDDEEEEDVCDNIGVDSSYDKVLGVGNQPDQDRVVSSSSNRNRNNRESSIFYLSEEDDREVEEREEEDFDLEEPDAELEWTENQEEEEEEEEDQGEGKGKERVLSDQKWDALFLMSQYNAPVKKHPPPPSRSLDLIDLTSVSSPTTTTHSTRPPPPHSYTSNNFLFEDDISEFDELPTVHSVQCSFPEPALAAHFRCVRDLIANRETSIDFSKFMMNIQEPSTLKYDKRKAARETKDDKKKTAKSKKFTSSAGKGKWTGFGKGKRFAKKT